MQSISDIETRSMIYYSVTWNVRRKKVCCSYCLSLCLNMYLLLQCCKLVYTLKEKHLKKCYQWSYQAMFCVSWYPYWLYCTCCMLLCHLQSNIFPNKVHTVRFSEDWKCNQNHKINVFAKSPFCHPTRKWGDALS